jgi:hypothetical protein
MRQGQPFLIPVGFSDVIRGNEALGGILDRDQPLVVRDETGQDPEEGWSFPTPCRPRP